MKNVDNYAFLKKYYRDKKQYARYFHWKTRILRQNEKKCLKRGRMYNKENKERLYKMVHHRYQRLSEEVKNKKREYARNRYRNMSKEKTKTKRTQETSNS